MDGTVMVATTCRPRRALVSDRARRSAGLSIGGIFAIVVVAGILGGVGRCHAQDASPDFSDVDDILGGQRVLVDVVDLLAVGPQPIGDGSTSTNPSRIVLRTDDGAIDSEISTSDGVVDCVPSDVCINPFPQQERIVRMFNQPNDVKVVVTVTANAMGTDCQGSNNLMIVVEDLVLGTSTTEVMNRSGAWVQLGVGDFDFDGYDDVFFINSVDMFVFTAVDVDDPSAGIAIHTTTKLPGAGYRALSQPSTGDLNEDGIADVVWAGGSKTGSQFVYVASVCPGDIANTVCDGAQPFDIVIDPLSFERIELVSTACGGPAATVGNFMPDAGDEVVAVYGTSGCSARARLLDFDGQLNGTEVGEVGVGNNTSNMFAETARFDWFGDTDQAVTLSSGLAIVGIGFEIRTVLSVITFTQNGSMTTHQTSMLVDDTNRFRGLATGVFGPPPSGFDDPTDFVPQIATLRVVSQTNPQNIVRIYDVDPDADFTPVETSVHNLPNSFAISNECGSNYGGSFLQAGDLYGRSVRVGEPDIIRITQSSQPQIILGTPPMHVDLVTLDRDSNDPPEIVNFSAIPSVYRSSYQTSISNTAQSARESTTSYSTSVKQTNEVDGSVGYKSAVTVGQTSEQVQTQTHDESVSQTYNTYVSESFDASTATGFGDQIWLTEQRFNIYAYPVVGQTSCPTDDVDCAVEGPVYMLFSGPDQIYRETHNGSTIEWYQPVHEPGNVFSYPWSLEQMQQRQGPMDLLTEAIAFFTDDSDRTVEVSWSGSQGMDTTSGTVDQYTHDTSHSVSGGVESDLFAGGETARVDVSTSESFATLNTSSTELGASTGIGIEKPDSFLDPGEYQYLVQPYVFGQPPADGTAQSIDTETELETTGILTTAYVADPTDSLAGSWWNSGPYVEYVDVALNHPVRWEPSEEKPTSTETVPLSCLPLSLGDVTETCMDVNDPNPTDPWISEFYWMRGLFVTVGGTAGPQATQAQEGDTLFLQARVYNYSLRAMDSGTEVHVRFYRQEWDHTTNRPLGDSVLVGEEVVDPIPPFNSETDTMAPNWQLVTTSLSTDGLGNTYTIFWVVVWLEDGSGGMVAELPGHGLTGVPGVLSSLADVPIEEVAVTDLSGTSRTTSLSNNVGFLKSALHILPSSTSSAIGSAAVSAARVAGRPRLDFVSMSVSPNQVDAGGRVIVEADLFSPDAHSDGVLVYLYDGDPDDGGVVFDAELLSRVPRGGTHQVRVPFHPNECGIRTLHLVASPNRPTEARATATVEVLCDTDPPDGGGSDDDSCQVQSGRIGGGSWLVVLGACMLAVIRSAVRRRRWARG